MRHFFGQKASWKQWFNGGKALRPGEPVWQEGRSYKLEGFVACDYQTKHHFYALGLFPGQRFQVVRAQENQSYILIEVAGCCLALKSELWRKLFVDLCGEDK